MVVSPPMNHNPPHDLVAASARIMDRDRMARAQSMIIHCCAVVVHTLDIAVVAKPMVVTPNAEL